MSNYPPTHARARRGLLPQRLVCALLVALLAVTTVLTCVPAQAIAAITNKEVTTEEQTKLYSNAHLGVIGGSVIELQAKEDFPNADLQILGTESDVATAVAGAKADYGFVTEFFATRFMENNSGYEFITPYYMSVEDAYAIAKGNDELRDKIDAVIARMREDGTLASIKKKWLQERNYTMEDVPTCETGDQVLRVAITSTDEPYCFIKDNELVGVAPEITLRIANELGMRVEFQEMNFAAEIAAVSTGKADIACQVTPTDERRQQVDFTAAYTSSDFGALAKDDSIEAPGFLQTIEDNINATFIVENRWQLIVAGLVVTAVITTGSFVLGTLLAVFLCWANRRRSPVARWLVRAYNKLATGVPVLVWLMIFYYVIFAEVDVSAVVVAILCFALQSASPISGIMETGLAAVDKGQIEASLAMGFSNLDTFRHIVAPQALARVWPLYSGQFTSLIKETSIVGYIAIQDLTKASDIIRSRTFQAFFPLIATAVVYFVIIALCSWIFTRLGRLHDPKRRSAQSILKGVNAR